MPDALLHRDVEVLVEVGAEPVGDGRLGRLEVPAGPERALRRAEGLAPMGLHRGAAVVGAQGLGVVLVSEGAEAVDPAGVGEDARVRAGADLPEDLP